MQSMFTARSALFAVSLILLAACGKEPPQSAFLDRGPEALLDVSSEVVNLSVATTHDRRDLSQWIAKDQPTRAELNCANGDKNCIEASKILDLRGVPVVNGNGANETVTLIYQRILAHDCSSRYVDNVPNHYNAYHPAFGCATSANIVQEVTDRQEFISPNLSDDPSAVPSVTAVRNAYTPRKPVDPYGVGDSTVSKSSTGSGS